MLTNHTTGAVMKSSEKVQPMSMAADPPDREDVGTCRELYRGA